MQTAEDFGIEPEMMADENVWGVIGDVLEWTFETEVSLAVVLVLLLIGVIREGVAAWIKFRTRGGHGPF